MSQGILPCVVSWHYISSVVEIKCDDSNLLLKQETACKRPFTLSLLLGCLLAHLPMSLLFIAFVQASHLWGNVISIDKGNGVQGCFLCKGCRGVPWR